MDRDRAASIDWDSLIRIATQNDSVRCLKYLYESEFTNDAIAKQDLAALIRSACENNSKKCLEYLSKMTNK